VRDLDVVVIGAGIGGLTAGVALQRTGHRVRILDQARQLRPVGAGISLWSNGVKVLDALGLGAEVAAAGGEMKAMGYRDKQGNTLCEFSLAPLVERVGEHPYPLRRSDLQALLLGALYPHVVHTGARCVGVDDLGDRVVVHLGNGEHLEGDLVVAADGTHSRLRGHVTGVETERVYMGYQNMTYVADGRRVSTMPVRDGQYVFFDVPLDDPVPRGGDPKEALRAHFKGWDPLVQQLIDAIDPAGVAHLAIHSHAPIERFSRGRVALLGDAAHTAAPDLGQGGCLAMEDALVLANFLATTSVSVSDALDRYSAERVPRAARIVERAASRSRLSHGHDPAKTATWYDGLRDNDGSAIIDGICTSTLRGPADERDAMTEPTDVGQPQLTTHVLDLTTGRPAARLGVTLSRLEDGATTPILTTATNHDGRTDAPLLAGDAMAPGTYELAFAMADYFASTMSTTSGLDPVPYLDVVPIRFGVSRAVGHLHIALLVSPWSYTTYRGS
jgi:FAD-dependent urate hydroxylase